MGDFARLLYGAAHNFKSSQYLEFIGAPITEWVTEINN